MSICWILRVGSVGVNIAVEFVEASLVAGWMLSSGDDVDGNGCGIIRAAAAAAIEDDVDGRKGWVVLPSSLVNSSIDGSRKDARFLLEADEHHQMYAFLGMVIQSILESHADFSDRNSEITEEDVGSDLITHVRMAQRLSSCERLSSCATWLRQLAAEP